MWETHLDFSGTLADSWQREGEAKSLSELQEKLKGVVGALVYLGAHNLWPSTT
jgi:hypothetical protein